MIDSWSATMEGKLKDTPHCFRRTNIATILIMVNFICSTIWRDNDGCTVWTLGDVLVDEIHHYQDCCYISPPEAMWCIFQFSLHGCTPTVYWLQLNLQGENQGYLEPGQGLPHAVQQAANMRSMLDAFYIVSALLCKFHGTLTHPFQANREYDFAKDVLYQDFPSYFTWKAKEMVWAPWKRGHAIGRIYNCGTRAGDHFYLCLLLTHIKGPQSEQHLCTVNGCQHATCKAACLALRILAHDGEWCLRLTEACQVHVERSIHHSLAVILAFNAPTHPR